MDRCPRCQFCLSAASRRCGWCGFELVERQAHWKPAAGHNAIIGVPNMPALGPTTLTMPPPTNVAGNTTDPNSAAYPYAPDAATTSGIYTIPSFASSSPTGFDVATLMAHSDVLAHALPLAAPPPPPQVGRWWLWVLGVLGLLGWITLETNERWADTASAFGHFAIIAAAIIFLGIVAQHNLRLKWRRCTLPLSVAGMLVLCGMVLLALTPLLSNWQAQQALQRHDYALALAIDTDGGRLNDAAQVQIAWAKDLAQSGDFAAAQSHADRALTASGDTQGVARETEGMILWQWGELAYQTRDLNTARTRWQEAASRFGTTPAGEQATTALAAPQTVTGRLVWLGAVAVPGMRVALVTGARSQGTGSSVQTAGARLEASTDTSGAFAIQGVQPGVTYTFLWVGGLGDFTPLNASGKPRYQIQVLPLAGGDLGTIAIDRS